MVSDDVGHKESVRFWTYVNNALTLEYEGESERYVALGATETLEVTASCRIGDVHFQWYRRDEETGGEILIDGATSASYTTEAVTSYTISEVTENGEYCCEVNDSYGNNENVWFYIYEDNNT